jgi:predicted  nucleic acid-binding Zn-ribbon protein
MFTESTITGQSTIQIASAFAVLLSALIALAGGALGTLASWWINGREMRRAKDEIMQIRSVRDSAQVVRQQALNERERALRELHSKVHEYGLIEADAQSMRRQLDHAQSQLRTTESQLEEMKAMVRATKRQSEEAQSELTSIEEQWNSKNQNIVRLNTQVRDLQNALDESRKQLNERYLTITALNAQLQEYRSRATESTNVVSNLQSAFSELSRRLQQQAVKMTETDLRTNDVQFAATVAAEVPLLTPRQVGVPVTPPSSPAPAPTVRRAEPAFAPASAVTPVMSAAGATDINGLENKLVSMLSELKAA